MDYTNNPEEATVLRKFQWDEIIKPRAIAFGWSEERYSEGQQTKEYNLDGFFFYPDGEFLGHTGGTKVLVMDEAMPKDLAQAYVKNRDKARAYNRVLTKVENKETIINVLSAIFKREIKSHLKSMTLDLDTKDPSGGACSGYGEIIAYIYKTDIYKREYFYDYYYNIVNLFYHENLHSLDFKNGIIWSQFKNYEQTIRHYKILQSQTDNPSFSKTTEKYKSWLRHDVAKKNYLDVLDEIISNGIRLNPETYKNSSLTKYLISKYDSFINDYNKRFGKNIKKRDWAKYYKDRINDKYKGECTLRLEDFFEGLITDCGFNNNLGRFTVKLNGENLMCVFPRVIIPDIEDKFKKGDYVIKEEGKSYYIVYKNNDKSKKTIINYNCSDWDSMNN